MVSFVYGSLNRKKRQDLWRNLRLSYCRDQTLWVIIGDFNVILASNEKFWGLSPGKRCPQFRDFVEDIDLLDLGFRGSPFT